MKGREYIYMESTQIPLTQVGCNLNESANIVNPITGKEYNGIILEGIFADLSNQPNNNKRIYDIPQYIEMVSRLKEQIDSEKGVYGELEHPEKYQVNFNNVSHKIIDIWWNQTDTGLTVSGRVLLLDTPKGKIAQEIVKSGGKLAISARAAGEEIDCPDGTKRAITKLLTTYDLVYHPGFSSAVLSTLNESAGFGITIYKDEFKKLNESYSTYINERINNRNEVGSLCYVEWFDKIRSLTGLNESQQAQDEKQQQQTIEENEAPEQQQLQRRMHRQSQRLKKQNDLRQSMYIDEMNAVQRQLKNKKDIAVYDDSAGFVTSGLDI